MRTRARPTEQELVRLRRQRLTYQEIADRVGWSVGWVGNQMASIDPFKGLKMVKAEKKCSQLMELYSQGMSDRDLMIASGLGLSTVWSWRQRHRLPENKVYRDMKKDRIFSLLWEQGHNDRQISKRSGYAVSSVRLWRQTRGLPSRGKSVNTRKTRNFLGGG